MEQFKIIEYLRWGDNRSPAFGNLINEVWYSSLANTQVNFFFFKKNNKFIS